MSRVDFTDVGEVAGEHSTPSPASIRDKPSLGDAAGQVVQGSNASTE